MLTGCINGMKSEENRYFRLKTSKITAYLHAFGLSFTWVCGVKSMGLQRKSITIASQSQCFCTKHRCQKGLKSSQCLAIY